MNHRKIKFGLIILLLTIAFGACEKSELSVTDNGTLLVKVFDDPLTYPDNSGSQIATGNNRIYMAYSFIDDRAGAFRIFNKLLTTDNEGAVINVYKFPEDIVIGDILVLADGSVMVSGCVFAQAWGGFDIHLFHLTQNGEFISSNVLTANCFLADSNYQGLDWILGMKLTRSLDGNILIFGNYSNASFGVNYPGYLIECDVNGNELWSKLNAVGGFTGCLTVNDGYVFSIHNQLKLVKTNASGDILWTSSFTKPSGSNFAATFTSKYVTQLANGHYLFESGIDTTLFNGGLVFSRLFEVSADGDSVNSVTIAADESRYIYGIFQQNDGSIFTVLNNQSNGNVSNNQQNSFSLILDSELKIKSKNYFQSGSTDVIIGGSKTSEGRIALFGLIQSYHRGYYKPELLILK